MVNTGKNMVDGLCSLYGLHDSNLKDSIIKLMSIAFKSGGIETVDEINKALSSQFMNVPQEPNFEYWFNTINVDDYDSRKL